MIDAAGAGHSHIFLGKQHQSAERRTWAVIWLCGAMMALEIGGGWAFGSIALIADGLHMSTHAGALLLAALAYTYAGKYAGDSRFTFGTGKLGDLAGFTSAIVLAMIALLIGYEAIARFISPVPIHAVNVTSAWLLSRDGHDHHHGHGHDHGGDAHDHPHDETHNLETANGPLSLSVYEDNHPPVFRLEAAAKMVLLATDVTIETLRPNGTRQHFAMAERRGYLESIEQIPEPHAFTATVHIRNAAYPIVFEEHDHGHSDAKGAAHRDNNMRAAIIHVVADAAVSVLVIVGLLLARTFGWLWMDPMAGIVGAIVIASWSYGLIRDTGAILLDMTPDGKFEADSRRAVEGDGDRLSDLHVWRLGPGHLGAIISVVTQLPRDAAFYRSRLARFSGLSHLTVEVERTS
jgi:cation diffusion facilitator family transporter